MMIARCAFVCLIVYTVWQCSISRLYAESVTWSLGKTIEVRIPPSTPDQIRSRTIVFPLAAVDSVINFHDDNDLDSQIKDNTITFRLKNPAFSGNVQVFDKSGNLFVLKISPANSNEAIDEVLFIKAPSASSGPSGPATTGDTTRWPSDLREASCIMLAHVFGDRQHPDIYEQSTESIVDGRRVPYTIIAQTDEFEMRMLRAWVSPTITGVLCAFIVKSEKPIRLDYRSLYPRGVVGIHAENQTVFDPTNPIFSADPGQVIQIFYTIKADL